jgi:hypothetical protein
MSKNFLGFLGSFGRVSLKLTAKRKAFRKILRQIGAAYFLWGTKGARLQARSERIMPNPAFLALADLRKAKANHIGLKRVDRVFPLPYRGQHGVKT